MDQYLGGLQAFLVWLAASLVLFTAFFALYLRITPHDEMKLIGEGNASAAVCLGGALLGYVLPLANAMVHGVNLHDFLVWGVIAMLVQLATYLALRILRRTLTADIVADRLSVAILAATLSLAVGILSAAAITP